MTFHASTPFYAAGFSDYNASNEGAKAYWDDANYMTTVRGMLKGDSTHQVAANTDHDIFVSDDGGKFPPPATGDTVDGSGVCKIQPATGAAVLRPCLIRVVNDAEVTMQTDVAGTVVFVAFDITYHGTTFTP